MSFKTMPFELLREIFKHATEIPWLLDATPEGMSADEEMQRAMAAVKASWTTRAAVRLVSRAFRAVVDDLAYEAILANDLNTFRQLLQRLEKVYESSGFHPGRHVKWLAFTIDIANMSPADFTDVDQLWQAISSFPNVEALYLAPVYYPTMESEEDHLSYLDRKAKGCLELSSRALENIFTAYGPSLRKIHLSAMVRLSFSDFRSSVVRLEEIESIVIRRQFYDIPAPELWYFGLGQPRYSMPAPQSALTLPKLQMLCIRHIIPILSHMALWDLPALMRLWLPYNLLFPASHASWTSFNPMFLQRHSRQLLILEVEWPDAGLYDCPHYKPISLESVPNMQQLMLHSAHWFPDVERHAFRSFSHQRHQRLTSIITYGWAPSRKNWNWEKAGGKAPPMDKQVESLVQAMKSGRFTSLRYICTKHDPGEDMPFFMEAAQSALKKYGVHWALAEAPYNWEDEADLLEWEEQGQMTEIDYYVNDVE